MLEIFIGLSFGLAFGITMTLSLSKDYQEQEIRNLKKERLKAEQEINRLSNRRTQLLVKMMKIEQALREDYSSVAELKDKIKELTHDSQSKS